MYLRIALSFFSLLTVVASTTASAQDRPQILGKIVWFGGSTETPVVEVIAFIDAGKPKDLEGNNKIDASTAPPEISMDSLLSFYHGQMKGRMFHLSLNGSVIGTARPTGPHLDSVLSDRLIGAYANLQATKTPTDQTILATSWQPKTVSGPSKEALPAQKKIALERGKALLKEKGLPSQLEARLEVVQCLLLNSGRLMVSVVHAYDSVAVSDHCVFFLTDLSARKEQYVKYSIGVEADISETHYIAHVDIDGDGVDEMILRNVYYEWLDYTILKLQKDQWISIFQGGGNGI